MDAITPPAISAPADRAKLAHIPGRLDRLPMASYQRGVVFQATMVVWGLASFAAAGAWGIGALMVCRVFIGVGVGGEAPVAQA